MCVLIVSCSDAPATDGGGGANAGGTTGTGGAPPVTGGTTGAITGGSDDTGPGTESAASDDSAGTGTVGPMDLWVAPDGLDTNPGTEALPFKTLFQGVKSSRSNSTIWMKDGVYPTVGTIDLNFQGNPTATMKIYAVEGARPILDFSMQAAGDSARGLSIQGNYYHIRGIEIMNAKDNCILISGSNNTIERVVTHGCGDTGIQITISEGQATNDALGANNQIINCDSYENLDVATNGENADGFAAKLRIGPGNVFRGCRAWNNADDGWDFFAADDVVTVEDSWAFENGIIPGGGNSNGDGNGFKLGGQPDGAGQGHAPHELNRVAGFDNRNCGFTLNNNDTTPSLSDCAVGGNGDDYCSVDCSPTRNTSTNADAAKAMPRNADGSLPALP